MREYSDEDLGARALNWVVIGGAALLFASFTSIAPTTSTEQSQAQHASVSAVRIAHA